MRALYAKNGALCASNGALIVGNETGDPPCACGQQGPVSSCCGYQSAAPGLVLGVLPPPYQQGQQQGWGPISVTFSSSASSRVSPAGQVPTVFAYSAVLNFGELPFIPFVPSECARYSISTTVSGTASGPNGTEIVVGAASAVFVIRSALATAGGVTARIQEIAASRHIDNNVPGTAVFSVGSFQWSLPSRFASPRIPAQVPPNISFAFPGATQTFQISSVGQTLTASHTFRWTGFTPQGHPFEENSSNSVTVSGLLPCTLPGTSLTGCANCPDTNTGAAIL